MTPEQHPENQTMHAVVATSAGGPEVLRHDTVDVPSPGPHDVLVRVAAAGVNFIDTYRRSGVYSIDYPSILGSEGSGVVEAVGSEVTDVAVGDHVAWSDAPSSYAELVVVPAARTLPVPGDVDLQVAAALPLQGMTAHYLATSTYPLGPGDTALVHAGAGGVGLLLTQLAAARGARVLTTVSTEEKAALSRAAGASEVVNYREMTDLTTELPRPRAHRRCGRPRRLRLRRQGHLRRLARLAAPTRHARALRRVVRPGAARRPPAAQRRRLALRHPPDPRRLRRDP